MHDNGYVRVYKNSTHRWLSRVALRMQDDVIDHVTSDVIIQPVPGGATNQRGC